jgi:lipoate---protein ligase
MQSVKSILEVRHSGWRDIFSNLAWEESLLLDDACLAPTLLFYSNSPALVIGRHQNPWAECDPLLLAELGIPLARRISGGGAVYHDEGNLNYALIIERERYERDRVLGAVCRALEALGFASELRNTSSIYADGRKVSGSAFCFKRGRVLHHGTLLIDADLAMLERLLKPSFAGIDSHAVKSVPAEVGNLAQMRAGTNAERCVEALGEAFADLLDCRIQFLDAGLNSSETAIAERTRELRAEDWVYGNAPEFRCSLRGRSGSELACRFVHGGLAELRSAGSDGALLPISGALRGARLHELLKSGLELF